MKLSRLTLHNYGTYKGSQTFDLSVGGERNIILIGGKNGAGKSTILEAIRVCFYGPHAFRESFGRDRYERFILDRMHRDPSSPVPPRAAAVDIEFSYGEEEGLASYRVTREWFRKNQNSISETVTVRKNGEVLHDIDPYHWQEFIEELLPPGVSELFFFDGEKIQLLADDESDAATLASAVSSLLGIELLEKLDADLAIYQNRKLQKSGAGKQDDVDLLRRFTEELEKLNADREAAASSLSAAQQELTGLANDLSESERELQRQGGNYAHNRGKLEERRRQINTKAEHLESTLREHATGLLPAAFAPNLLKQVVAQLETEHDVRFAVVVDESLARAARLSLGGLRKLDVRKGNQVVKLADLPEFSKIEEAIKRHHSPQDIDAAMIHDLSGEQERQILAWATVCLQELPKEIAALGAELENVYRERQKVERDLSRVPDDETLAPVLSRIQKLRQKFAEQTEIVAQEKLKLEQIEQACLRAEQDQKKHSDRVMSVNTERAALERASKVQAALKMFREALVERKLKEIESEVTRAFQLITRKKLSRVFSIDPITFSISLKDDLKRQLPKSELSAGEKQMYAIAVLWALARVSQRPAPIIIDTPLARLDSEHRSLLLEEYFPSASHQVIVLSTDTEIDESSLDYLRPHLASSYELDYTAADEATVVRSGYFGVN